LSNEAKNNLDEATVAGFGDEWSRYDQSKLDDVEQTRMFDSYFRIFPWFLLPPRAEGFDMGCGSGRWAKLVLPRVRLLHCIDASSEALDVARRNLANAAGARFVHSTVENSPLGEDSQDFGYSLGVLHHVPDTQAAINACVRLLKPGAPFLIYLYYRFDNRPKWFIFVWRVSDYLRLLISRLPYTIRQAVTYFLALTVYLPLARIARAGERLGFNMQHLPLYSYRQSSFYSMCTDARDRFGTRLEQRFTRDEVRTMLDRAGLVNVVISESEPFWCAVGIKRGVP
jgi:SAM-dependent methyltransferase